MVNVERMPVARCTLADPHSNIILSAAEEPFGSDETGRFGDETPPEWREVGRGR
ncbi:MAG: hypothetical protein LW865_01370 [Betaproteobacteria bacterium]|jgi:hypothetical protein|nr:hypothetical protein [Betaproteobacteria bacterium]